MPAIGFFADMGRSYKNVGLNVLATPRHGHE